jgi:BirA family transcriptional regulator, biotin operon repressor / biotin---[acetyl-CoA-carboxylase] ligase
MDILDQNQIKNDLNLPDVRYFSSIGSTNDAALQWALEGAVDGSLVIADEQTIGRGRHARRWHTQPGSALAFSLILRPKQLEEANLSLFSPLGGVAVCAALHRGWNLPAEIKWPNDILIHRKKVCGILAETSWEGSRTDAVILGIGINIAHNSIPPAEGLQFPATCIEDEFGQPIPRYEILKMVVNTFFEWRKEMAKPEFFQYWQEHLAFQGEPVRIIEDGKTVIYGTQSGILPDGRLEITTENDAKIGISAGDLHLRPGK